MPELAQDSFPSLRYSAREEAVSSEKRRAAENLTNAGSFQPHGARRIQREWEAHLGTARYPLHVFGEVETSIVSAALGSTPTLVIADIRMPALQGAEIVARVSDIFSAGQFSVFTIVEAERRKADKQKIALEITDEAKRRLAGHEEVTEKLLSIVEKEASGLNITLKTITVRPAWSHEYEDYTGVVIDVEVAGNNNQRFALWDAISSKLDALLDSLTPEEQSFLADNISVVVTQG